jgi:hypothetical protein
MDNRTKSRFFYPYFAYRGLSHSDRSIKCFNFKILWSRQLQNLPALPETRTFCLHFETPAT